MGLVFMYEMRDNRRLDQTISQSCQRFTRFCGKSNMSNAVVVTWSGSPVQDAERKANELYQAEPFSPILGQGARMHQFDGSPESASATLRLFVHEEPVTLACQCETLRTGDNPTQGPPEPPSPEANCCCSWWPWRRN